MGQVFAGFEPNMPRVATASGGGGGEDVQQKSIVRSASAISLTAGRGKVRKNKQQHYYKDHRSILNWYTYI